MTWDKDVADPVLALLGVIVTASATLGAAWVSAPDRTGPDCVQVLADIAGLYQRQPEAVRAWSPDEWATADECGVASFVPSLATRGVAVPTPLPGSSSTAQPTPHR